MLSVSAAIRIFVCREPTDMRRSFEGLCGMVRQIVKEDPVSGAFFVFLSRGRGAVKVLYWEFRGHHT